MIKLLYCITVHIKLVGCRAVPLTVLMTYILIQYTACTIRVLYTCKAFKIYGPVQYCNYCSPMLIISFCEWSYTVGLPLESWEANIWPRMVESLFLHKNLDQQDMGLLEVHTRKG